MEKGATKLMKKNNELIWHGVGCIVFMMLGFFIWYLLYAFIGWKQTYVIIALINIISYTGYGVTNQIMQRINCHRFQSYE